MKIRQITLVFLVVYVACLLSCAGSSSITSSVGEIVYNNAEDFEYTRQNQSITITKYKGKSSTVNIPPVIEGLPVTAIGSHAFDKSMGVNRITIPKSVKTVSNSAFYYTYYENRRYVDRLPNISIEKGANISAARISTSHTGSVFGYHILVAGDDIYAVVTGYYGSSRNVTIPAKINGIQVKTIGLMGRRNITIERFTIPEGVIRIAKDAFINYNLTSVILPRSLIYIDEDAFRGNRLTSITIPEGVTHIGERAFSGNPLTSVTIPDSVTFIGNGAFRGYTGIEREYAQANTYLANNDFANAVNKYLLVLRFSPEHSGAQAGLMFAEYELANAGQGNVNYAEAITHYRDVLRLDQNHTRAKNNLKAVWDRRIAENQNLYPAPFAGRWQFIQPASTIPARTEYYTERVPNGYTTESYTVSVRRPLSTGYMWVTEYRTRQVPSYRDEQRSREIPARTIPEQRFVYEFNGNNYIAYTDGKQMSSGTFYYRGNTIELEDGTILQIRSNGIQSGNNIYTKQ